MARALAAGFVRSGLLEGDRIRAADPLPAAREALLAELPAAQVFATGAEVARAADVLVLAVKPQQMEDALAGLRAEVGPGHLLVSIAAGVSTASIAAALEPGVRVVRVMPNTPCLLGKGACGYALGSAATEADGRLVGRLLAAVGEAFPLAEKQLDAVTGLSGSGPAFVYTVIEALSDGGVLVGLPRNVSARLAAQTVAGAAEMVLQTGEHPAALKDRVASPGGTTIAGMEALESAGLRAALIAAVEAATQRSIELGQS